jgi:hypothetical protein
MIYEYNEYTPAVRPHEKKSLHYFSGHGIEVSLAPEKRKKKKLCHLCVRTDFIRCCTFQGGHRGLASLQACCKRVQQAGRRRQTLDRTWTRGRWRQHLAGHVVSQN